MVKFIRFISSTDSETERVGIVENGPLTRVRRRFSSSSRLKNYNNDLKRDQKQAVDLTAALGIKNMVDLIKYNHWEKVDAVMKSGDYRVSVKRVLAPLKTMEKVLCVGMNYVDHCTEQNFPIPKEPIIFNKMPSTVTNPGDDIELCPYIKELDFEVELVIVVGKGGRYIPKDKAMEHVFGYTVAHDVSARHWQLKRNGQQWLLGKTFDTFTPLGPCVVDRDSIDPHDCRIRCVLNGKKVQDSSTNQLIFKTPELIAWCSRFMTLRPGDLILTGTPPGVGCFRKPPMFMKHGDVVTCEIEGIGSITNTVRETKAIYSSL